MSSGETIGGCTAASVCSNGTPGSGRAFATRRHRRHLCDERRISLCFVICCTRSSNGVGGGDRKSTRLNSSHSQISYAVFCLKKKKSTNKTTSSHVSTQVTVKDHRPPYPVNNRPTDG